MMKYVQKIRFSRIMISTRQVNFALRFNRITVINSPGQFCTSKNITKKFDLRIWNLNKQQQPLISSKRHFSNKMLWHVIYVFLLWLRKIYFCCFQGEISTLTMEFAYTSFNGILKPVRVSVLAEMKTMFCHIGL